MISETSLQLFVISYSCWGFAIYESLEEGKDFKADFESLSLRERKIFQL